ncbi:MAG: hypothetical protein E6713_18435, partial [Sporomusaceae bacterium]|nr:hypothetical protein [Sporomusaceae bacterium]
MLGFGRKILRGRFFLLAFSRKRLEQKQNTEQSLLWLKKAFLLLFAFLKQGKTVEAVQIIEQLKSAYGNGWHRENEPIKLTLAIAACLKTKQHDMAVLLFAAFTPLFRCLNREQQTACLSQLAFLALISARYGQIFLCAKAADLTLLYLEKNESSLSDIENRPAVAAGLLTVGRIGSIAVRRDQSLFREIVLRYTRIMERSDLHSLEELPIAPWVSWLRKSVSQRTEDTTAFLLEAIATLVEQGSLSKAQFAEWILESQSIACQLLASTKSTVTPLIVSGMIEAALQAGNVAYFEAAAASAGRICRIAVQQRGYEQIFPLLYPFLKKGRVLLRDECRLGYSEASQGFRQHCLFIIMKELSLLMHFVLRQEAT